MNLGIQDAINLAWKLTMILLPPKLAKSITEGILDSYSSERDLAAEAMTASVQAQIAVMKAETGQEMAVRNVIAETLGYPELNALGSIESLGLESQLPHISRSPWMRKPRHIKTAMKISSLAQEPPISQLARMEKSYFVQRNSVALFISDASIVARQLEGPMRSFNAWLDKMTVVCAATKDSDEK